MCNFVKQNAGFLKLSVLLGRNITTYVESCPYKVSKCFVPIWMFCRCRRCRLVHI